MVEQVPHVYVWVAIQQVADSIEEAESERSEWARPILALEVQELRDIAAQLEQKFRSLFLLP